MGTSAPITQRSSLLYSLYFISEWTEPGGYQCSVHSALVPSLFFVFYFWVNGARWVPVLRSLSGRPFFILCNLFLSERSQVCTSAPFTQRSSMLYSLYFISEWTEPRWVPVLRSLSGRPFFILCIFFVSERSQVGTSAPFTQWSSLLYTLYFFSEWTEPGGYQCSVHSAVVPSLFFVFYFWVNGA